MGNVMLFKGFCNFLKNRIPFFCLVDAESDFYHGILPAFRNLWQSIHKKKTGIKYYYESFKIRLCFVYEQEEL